MAYADFIKKWGEAELEPRALSHADLDQVTAISGVAFPQAAATALIEHGAVSVRIGLLNAIADRDLNCNDVQEFLTASEMIETTATWREMGFPSDAVAFATDCSGNLFCFRVESDAVWFWDHDFRDIEKIAPSFEKWLARYNKIKPVADDD